MNLKVKHLLVVVIFFSTTINAQNLKSIYKNIVKEDYNDVQAEYNKSNNEFNKEEKILFELSKCIIYSKSKYQSFKPREAYSIYKSLSIINLTQNEQININEFLSKYTYNISGIYDTIIKGVFLESKNLNTIESYEEAIQICNDCKYKIELLNLKEVTAYKQALNYGNVEVLEQFLINYPTSKLKDEIEGLLHTKAFERATLINTILSLNEYILKYSNSKLISNAYRYRDSLVLKSTNKTYNDYLAFNQDYPNSFFNSTIATQLPDLLFNEISVDNDYYKMLEFVRKYPRDTRVEDVKSRIKSMKYYEISVNKVNNLKIEGDCNKYGFSFNRKNNLINISNLGYIDTLGNLKYEEYFDFKTMGEGIDFGDFFEASINGKHGIIDSYGKIIAPFKYDRITLEKDYIIVELNKKMAVLDLFGKELIPNIYEEIECSRYNKFFEVELNKKHGYIDSLGKIIIPIIYDDVIQINDLYFEVRLNGKYGVLDKYGKVVIPIIYDGVNLFMNDYFNVYLNNKYGVSNNLGEIIVPLKYDEINSLNNNIIKVELNKKSGLVDFKGSELTPVIYDKFPIYEHGVLVGKLNNQCVFIDSMGRILSTVTFSFSNFKVNKFLSQNLVEIIELDGYNNKFSGIIDIKGNIILPISYKGIRKQGDLIMFCESELDDSYDRKIGVLNLDGKVILPLARAAHIFGNVIATGDYYLTEYNKGVYNNCILLDKNGNQISNVKYKHITFFNNSFNLPTTIDENGKYNYSSEVVFQADIEGNNKIYLFDLNGKILPVSNKYSNLAQIDNDCYIREIDGNYSLVDKNGNELTKFKYESIEYIVLPNQSTFICKKNGKYGLLDIHGKELTQFLYEDLSRLDFLSELDFDMRNGIQNQGGYLFYLGKKNGKYGLLDNNGKELTIFKYEEITKFGVNEVYYNDYNYKKVFKAKFNGKYGLINSNGLEIIPCNSNNSNIISYTNQNYVVYKDNNYCLFDKNGNQLTPYKYKDIKPEGSFFISRINDKYGITDKNGKEITEFKYSSIEYITNNIFIVNENCEIKIIKLFNN